MTLSRWENRLKQFSYCRLLRRKIYNTANNRYLIPHYEMLCTFIINITIKIHDLDSYQHSNNIAT